MTRSTYISGLLILLCSVSVFGQKKKNKSTDSVEEMVFIQSEGLSITQNGHNNSLLIDQTADSTRVDSNGETQIFTKGSNTTTYRRSSAVDASASGSNSARVTQSGNGNRAIIKQSGGSNTITVSQGPATKKED